MLTLSEVQEARALIEHASRPLFLFDDDCDGLCAYLVLKKWAKKGVGIPLKSSPTVDPMLTKKVEELRPDLVVILDKAVLSQGFIDGLQSEVMWLDHHPPLKRKKVHYFNPRVHNSKEAEPTTYLAWQITQQDLWIATVGCIADWFIPGFLPEFMKAYPGLISKHDDPGTILFATEFGNMVKIFYFILKGKAAIVKKNLQLLEKIGSPVDLLKGGSEEAQIIREYVAPMVDEYKELLEKAKEKVSDDKIFLFVYPSSKNSYTQLLANEVSFLYPDKLVIVGREKDNEVRMSIRNKDMDLPRLLEKALVNVHGHGGGHEHACGSAVSRDDFDRFMQNIKEAVA